MLKTKLFYFPKESSFSGLPDILCLFYKGNQDENCHGQRGRAHSAEITLDKQVIHRTPEEIDRVLYLEH
jgi:hypothetical protein